MDNRLFTLPSSLVREYATRDPFLIARHKGYTVRYLDLKKQKGFCTNIYNNFFIFINQNLSDQMKRMTCAHELAHIILHKDQLGRDSAGRFSHFVEMELFDITNQTEYEANLFAANLLIDEEDLMRMLTDGQDIVSIASTMDVNVNMLALKLAELGKMGFPIDLPLTPDRGFLGRIEDRADSF